jgi:hypothetical protein
MQSDFFRSIIYSADRKYVFATFQECDWKNIILIKRTIPEASLKKVVQLGGPFNACPRLTQPPLDVILSNPSHLQIKSILVISILTLEYKTMIFRARTESFTGSGDYYFCRFQPFTSYISRNVQYNGCSGTS